MKIGLVPIAVMFTFDTKNKKTRTKFYRELYGCINSSNFGKYKYKRKGLLSDTNYIKPTNSTIIIEHKQAPLLRKFLHKNKIKFTENIIILHTKEARILNLKYHDNWDKIIKDLKGSKNLLVTVDF